MIARLRYFGFN